MFEAFSIICKEECFSPVDGIRKIFMYKIKRRGPRILPWGTPDAQGVKL